MVLSRVGNFLYRAGWVVSGFAKIRIVFPRFFRPRRGRGNVRRGSEFDGGPDSQSGTAANRAARTRSSTGHITPRIRSSPRHTRIPTQLQHPSYGNLESTTTGHGGALEEALPEYPRNSGDGRSRVGC